MPADFLVTETSNQLHRKRNKTNCELLCTTNEPHMFEFLWHSKQRRSGPKMEQGSFNTRYALFLRLHTYIFALLIGMSSMFKRKLTRVPCASHVETHAFCTSRKANGEVKMPRLLPVNGRWKCMLCVSLNSTYLLCSAKSCTTLLSF